MVDRCGGRRAVVFFAAQAFFSRGILRGPLPPLQGALADGTAITAAQWQRVQGGDAVPTPSLVGRRRQVRAATQGYTSEIGIRLRLWWAGRSG
jgi:hypothetical protein